MKGSNRKAMPIYDLNGNLAGIQAAVSICHLSEKGLSVAILLDVESVQPCVTLLGTERDDCFTGLCTSLVGY